MPNFKIIQDSPDQARIKIYGSQNVALNTDASGNMSVTPPANGLTVTAAADGLSITPPAGGLSITPPSGGLSVTAPANGLTVTASADGLSITPPAGGLSITPPSGGLSVTAPANGLTVTAAADGLSITPPAGGLAITPPANGMLITSSGLPVISALATTDVSYNITAITEAAGSADTTYTVLSLKDWSFGLVNNSAPAGLGEVWAKLQLSPDGTTWFEDEAVTLSVSTAYAMVPGKFLKYARVYYGAVGTTAVTLSIYFQGQS